MRTPVVRPGRRRLGRRVLALVAGAAGGLVAAEFAYRWTRVPGLSPTTHPAYVAHDDELGWVYRPSSGARHRAAEFDVAVAINAQGFRGPEWPAARDGRPLVLVVGDSIVFGWGVEEAESLCGLLRTRKPQWDVRGVGVSGYGPDQQLLLTRRIGRQLRADVLVCVSCANDAYEVTSAVAYGLRKPRFEREGDGVRLVSTPGPDDFLHEHSLLWRALNKIWWRWHFDRSPVADDWGLVTALYRTMRSESNGARFVLVGAQDELRQFAGTMVDTAYVDLDKVLPRGGAWTFPIDSHWNAAGHARVADAVAGEVHAALRALGR